MSDIDTSAEAIIPAPLGTDNRGYDTALDIKDTELLVTLERINEIIIGYLRDRIIPTVSDNNSTRPVPILYGTEERWVAIRKEGFIRDTNTTKLMTPLIVLRRSSVKKSPLMNPNNKYMHRTLVAGWDKRNAYDKFSVLNRIRPRQQIKTVIIPDYMDLIYEGLIWTEYQSQMDRIIEQINVENEEFWGDRNNFKFRVSIDSFDSQSDIPDSGDRVIRAGFQMKIAAYLLPERALKNMKIASTQGKEFTKELMITFTEFVDSTKNIP